VFVDEEKDRIEKPNGIATVDAREDERFQFLQTFQAKADLTCSILWENAPT